MTREEIIRMAREAGLTDESFERDWYVFQLERFAALVAAAAKAEEREACAQLCEELETCSDAEFYGHEFAAAIRERSTNAGARETHET